MKMNRDFYATLQGKYRNLLRTLLLEWHCIRILTQRESENQSIFSVFWVSAMQVAFIQLWRIGGILPLFVSKFAD